MVAYFNGTTDGLEPTTPLDSAWDFGAVNFSIAFSVQRGRTGHSTDEVIVDKYRFQRASSVGWAVRLNAGNGLAIRIATSTWTVTNAITDTDPHWVVISVQRINGETQGVTVYIDGTRSFVAGDSDYLSATAAAQPLLVAVNQWHHDSAYYYWFQGTLGHLAILRDPIGGTGIMYDDVSDAITTVGADPFLASVWQKLNMDLSRWALTNDALDVPTLGTAISPGDDGLVNFATGYVSGNALNTIHGGPVWKRPAVQCVPYNSGWTQ